MPRPVSPIYTVRRGGSSIEVRNEETNESTTESFIDVMRHYPPLHHIVGRIRVYEAIWHPGQPTDLVSVSLPDGRTIRIIPPSRVSLRPPRAASLAALGGVRRGLMRRFIHRAFEKFFYAYGYVDKDKLCVDNCPVYEYSEAPTGGHNVRSVILYADESVLERYHSAVIRNLLEQSVKPDDLNGQSLRIPYYQPVIWDSGSRTFCMYAFEAWMYNGHPLLHEAAVPRIVNRKAYEKCLSSLLAKAGFKHKNLVNILLPSDTALTVTTPPRFYPQYRSYVIEERSRSSLKHVAIGSLVLRYCWLDVRVAIVLESVRAFIRGRLVAPVIRDTVNDAFFGDVIDTQAVSLEVLRMPRNTSEIIARLVAQDGEIRSKLAYHMIYDAVRDALRNVHDENVQHAALKLWRGIRLYHILKRIVLDELASGGTETLRKLIAEWALMYTLYMPRCPEKSVMNAIRNRRVPGDTRRPIYSIIICPLLGMLERDAGVEIYSRGSATKRRCEEILSERGERVYKAILEALRLLRERSLGDVDDEKRRLLKDFAKRVARHTLVHWLVAVQAERTGIGEGDVEAVENTESHTSLIYEMFEGGVGASKSIATLLEDSKSALKLLADWLYGICLPMKVQHQLHAILSDPETLGRLWRRLHGAPRSIDVAKELRSVLGEEPQHSVVERVIEMSTSIEKLIEMLTLHALIHYVYDLSGIYPRPEELAALYTLVANVEGGRLCKALADRLAGRVKKVLEEAGIDVPTDLEALVKRSLVKIFEGRATLEELLGLEQATGEEGRGCRSASMRSIALAMEEYGGLWWLDGHPICHGVVGCGRMVEERDINAPSAYLSPRLLQELTVGRS